MKIRKQQMAEFQATFLARQPCMKENEVNELNIINIFFI